MQYSSELLQSASGPSPGTAVVTTAMVNTLLHDLHLTVKDCFIGRGVADHRMYEYVI